MKRRDDKSWEEATTSEQFADMYRRQSKDAPVRDTEVVIKRDSADEGGEEEEEEADEVDEADGDEGDDP